MSSATVNIYILVFVWIYVFSSQMALVVKNPPASTGDMRDTGLTHIQSLGWEDSLEEGMVTHSCILVWRIPTDRVLGELQSMGSKSVGHD